MNKPIIAVLMDENTSSGGNQYAMGKGYFTAIAQAGGIPLGVPYEHEILSDVSATCDGLLCPGGRFAYADGCYMNDLTSNSPVSDRLAIETALIKDCLALDKPVLGICAGMQLLGCLHGAKMTPDLVATEPDAQIHDQDGRAHWTNIVADSMLHQVVGASKIETNTYHREALVEVSDVVKVSAFAPDGIIEAIELPYHRFALGVQWHPEKMLDTAHSKAIFAAFFDACQSA